MTKKKEGAEFNQFKTAFHLFPSINGFIFQLDSVLIRTVATLKCLNVLELFICKMS